jgi:transposase
MASQSEQHCLAMTDTVQTLRERVIALSQHTSKTHREIAEDLQMCQSTVTRIISHYRCTGSTETSRRGCCGRRSKLCDRDKRSLIQESIKNPQKTARELQVSVGEPVRNISIATVKRVLRDGGRRCYRPRKVHKLDKEKMVKRYDWAKRHLQLTQEQWNMVRNGMSY